MFYLLFSQILLAQEAPPADETYENTPIEEEQEVKEQKTDAEASFVKVELLLKNGVRLAGEMPIQEAISWSPEKEGVIHFRLDGQKETEISYSDIESIDTTFPQQKDSSVTDQAQPKQNETAETYISPQGFSYQNPAASRYLYSPSSIGLQKGQGYVSQKLLFTAGVYALTDNITVLFGGLGPFVTVLGGKASTKIADNLHISAGNEIFFLPFQSFDSNPVAANISFAGFTLGNLDRHISVNSGYLYTSDDIDGEFLKGVPVVISAHTRTSERVALVTENWLLFDPAYENPYKLSIGSLAFRIIGRRDANSLVRGTLITKQGYPRSTWDIGVIFAHGVREHKSYMMNQELTSEFVDPFTFGPIPWVDYTWHFGPARK